MAPSELWGWVGGGGSNTYHGHWGEAPGWLVGSMVNVKRGKIQILQAM